MQPYVELNAHCIGKSHIQNGIECEDYSASYSDDNISIAVISDGHGDRNCFRSRLGAKYACEIAVCLCRKFQAESIGILDIQSCDFDELLTGLEADIADTWKKQVTLDAQNNPFSEDELQQASGEAQKVYRAGNRLEKAYGCTLIVAVITARYWFGIQIGDGKCVAAYDDGVYVAPIPTDDENCCGNRSTSLCNTNTKELFRHYYSMVCPVSVFVVSDGVEESFDQLGLLNCFFSVAYWLKDAGYDAAQLKLNELLPQISEGGSGDDVSLSAIVSQRTALNRPRQTLEQVYERVNSCANLLSRYNALLESSQARLEEKEHIVAITSAQIDQLTQQLSRLQEELEMAEDERVAAEGETAEIQEKRALAIEQMDKAIKYKESAELFWKGKLDVLGLPFITEEIAFPPPAAANAVKKQLVSTEEQIIDAKQAMNQDQDEAPDMLREPIPVQQDETVLMTPIDSLDTHIQTLPDTDAATKEQAANEEDFKPLTEDDFPKIRLKSPLSQDDDEATAVEEKKKWWPFGKRSE